MFNEWYARDTSRKIRAVKYAKGMAGEKMSNHALYGYRKDSNNPKHWIIDEEAAEVVRQIFRDCLAGLGTTHIANKLRDAKIDTPATHALKIGFPRSVKPPEIPYDWNAETIARLLSCREYLGHTVNFKTTKKSYKSKKTVYNDPREYSIFENTHEAIIDQDTFDRVQQIRAAGKRRRDASGRVSLFSGMVYCADCGSKLNFSSGASQKPNEDFYKCSGFTTKKKVCGSSHFIRRVVLEQLVLEKIQQVTAFASKCEQEFAEMLRQDNTVKNRKELAESKRKLNQSERRIVELDNIIGQLYEDKVAGVLTSERFMKLSQGYEKEQQDLQVQVAELSRRIAEQEQQTLDLSRFLTQVRKYTHIEELTPTLLNELVERIAIHAPDKSSGKRVVEIDVYFNFVGLVGKLDLPKSSKLEKAMKSSKDSNAKS